MTTIGLIDGYRRFDCVTVEELCRKAGISMTTYHRRLHNPDDLTIGECQSLCKALRLNGERKTKVQMTLI